MVGSAITAAPTQFDVISFNHVNTDVNNNAVQRYIGYSNVGDNPQIKAYDKKFASNQFTTATNNDGYLTVTVQNQVITDNLEVFRFQQNDTGNNGTGIDFISQLGSNEIAIKSASNNNTHTTFVLDHIVTAVILYTPTKML